jgi:hypothetical protein
LSLLLLGVLILTITPMLQVRASFKFTRVQTDCNTNCDQGGCAYRNCRDAKGKGVSCDGGACSFDLCTNPRCKGGACLFNSCTGAQCAGGGCDFTNQKETLHLDSCTGENCKLNGASLPVLHRGEYLTI